MILLNPGPTNTHNSVKDVQTANTDICHRTSEFIRSYDKLKEELVRVFDPPKQSKWKVSILCGSGTAALEAMITSLVPQKITTIVAGKYGERALRIMDLNSISYDPLYVDHVGELQPDKSVEFLYFVENETTTGESFPLSRMVELYPNATFYIDSTSAFGATEYRKYSDQIGALSFCSNKCLQSPAGLGIVIYPNAAPLFNRSSLYFDLSLYQDQLPFTVPPQLVSALLESLRLRTDSETTFNTKRDNLIKDFKTMGINCINRNPSNSVIGFVHPTMSYNTLMTFLKKKDIIIYSGIPGVENSFRVSTMSVDFNKKYDYIKGAFHDSCLC